MEPADKVPVEPDFSFYPYQASLFQVHKKGKVPVHLFSYRRNGLLYMLDSEGCYN